MSDPNPGAAPAPQWSVVAEKLTKVYDGKTAVDGVDLAVAPGEFFGILGPNGAGKSTTIKMFCGLVRPTSGRAFVLGHDVRDEPLAVKSKIGIMPEEVNTYERLTADAQRYFEENDEASGLGLRFNIQNPDMARNIYRENSMNEMDRIRAKELMW